MAQVAAPEEKGVTPASAAESIEYASSMDALVERVTDGRGLHLNIIASLFACTSLAALIDIILGAPLTLERILGWGFAALIRLAGVPWTDAHAAGEFMGLKTAINERVAYIKLSEVEPGTFDLRTILILVYSLCGFANFSALGIVVGGRAALAPDRRADIIDLAPRALVSGTLATLMTGAVIGLIWAG